MQRTTLTNCVKAYAIISINHVVVKWCFPFTISSIQTHTRTLFNPTPAADTRTEFGVANRNSAIYLTMSIYHLIYYFVATDWWMRRVLPRIAHSSNKPCVCICVANTLFLFFAIRVLLSALLFFRDPFCVVLRRKYAQAIRSTHGK